MNQKYYSIITQRGLRKQANGLMDGELVRLTHLAIGDSNGEEYDPTGLEHELKNEVYRVNLARIAVDSADDNRLNMEAIITAENGPFWIREVGIYDSDGELFAIGKYPATYKPIIEDGAIKDLCVRMILQFDNASNIELVYNAGMGGGGSATTFLSHHDYGFVKEDVPFFTEDRPQFEYDFAVGDLTYDYGFIGS